MYKLLPSSDTDPHPQLLRQSVSVLRGHTTARKGHNYFTYKLSRPKSGRKQQQTASNKSMTRTHAFIAYTNMFSNDITTNEQIEKIKKHQPICHKHQFLNSLPALEPLP